MDFAAFEAFLHKFLPGKELVVRVTGHPKNVYLILSYSKCNERSFLFEFGKTHPRESFHKYSTVMNLFTKT